MMVTRETMTVMMSVAPALSSFCRVNTVICMVTPLWSEILTQPVCGSTAAGD